MKSFDIDSVSDFYSELINNEKYDSFYLYEARIKVGIDYYINGKQNTDYFDTEDKDNLQEYVTWKEIKKVISVITGGDKMPISFRIILMFNRDNIKKLIEMNNMYIKLDDIGALFYNIYYENGKMSVTTGTSLKVFSLDKTMDQVWEDAVTKYYI